MCQIEVKVSKKNAKFVLYNHLFSKGKQSFSLDELQSELETLYGLEMETSELKNEIDDYLNSGLVIHDLNRYECCME
jgi:hypothetical protein